MNIFRCAVLFCVFSGSLGFAQSDKLYIFSTDYNPMTSDEKIVALDAQSLTSQVLPITGLYQDSVLKAYNGFLYVIERYGSDAIKIYDALDNYSLVNTVEFNASANPQDIGFISPSKAYVTLYNENNIAIINPTTGANLGSIPLSAYAVQDGIADVSKILVVNGRAYVVLQNLVNYQPVANGAKLIVIDVSTDQVLQSIALPLQNPVTRIVFQNAFSFPRLLIGASGQYGAQDGGFVGIPLNIANNALGTPSIVPPSETILGGDISEIAKGQDPTLDTWYSITDSKLFKHVGDNNSPVTIASSNTPYTYADVASDPDHYRVFLADRSGSGTPLKAFNAFSNAAIALNNLVPMQPASLAMGKDMVTFTNEAKGEVSYFNVFPNPATAENVHVQFATGKSGKYTITVYSVGGTRVSTLETQVSSEQAVRLPISRDLTKGVYAVVLSNAQGRSLATKKLVIE